MSIVTAPAQDAADAPAPVKRRRSKRSTSHLKLVPETLELREEFKVAAEQYAAKLDHSRPFNKNELEQHGRTLLEETGQPEKFLGFSMVMIGNFFWKRQFLATPFERRMLLLPHCLKHAEGCPAEYDEFGLDCEKCGACSIADYKVTAEKLGYKVLVAEGSPVVLKIIVSGYIDAILGVACLNVLEKAIDKVLIAGVPSYAVPLHSGDCKNTKMDEPWLWEVLDKYEPLPAPRTASYIPLMRAANTMFEDRFAELLPPQRLANDRLKSSPIAETERIAFDFLQHGGKRFRPFITLAAYDAATGGDAQTAEDTPVYSPAISRVAMSIEAFHKASLVHDDIQDDDQFRYGKETLHRSHGTGMAINVGDYLIGIGYKLLNSARDELGSDIACDILDRMAQAHIKLCDGQGAEMAWQEADEKSITPLEALQIYALKTSPAFEAALYAGLRMAGPTKDIEDTITAFSRHLGVGFQVLNDLKDWRGDGNNKLVAGQDAEALRPTVLLALAMESATGEDQRILDEILRGDDNPSLRATRLHRIFEANGIFKKAEALVDKSRARAETLADDVENDNLRQLLYFFVDTVLAEEDTTPTPAETAGLVALPIA